MKIGNILETDLIFLDFESRNKEVALEDMVGRINKKVRDTKEVLEAINRREKLGTTAVGDGVALPHCRTSAIKKILAAFFRSTAGIDFEAEDGEPVHLIFLILAPDEEWESYLEVLAQIARLCKEEKNRNALLKANNPGEVIKFIKGVSEGI
ncbi:MAG: PTS sugar transporter subunit IIA [bacterium]